MKDTLWLVFRLGQEKAVDRFFLYDKESDAAEMCLALAQEELWRKLYLDYMVGDPNVSIYSHEPTLLDSCWFVTECHYKGD